VPVECLRGSQGNDRILAEGFEPGTEPGHLTIAGWGGADTIIGGPGDDRLYGDNVSLGSLTPDNIDDHDYVAGGSGADHIYGGHGVDHLVGGDGADVVDGTDRPNVVDLLIGSEDAQFPEGEGVNRCLYDFLPDHVQACD
jgi:Ca2+-binding RTX toxin-like protein